MKKKFIILTTFEHDTQVSIKMTELRVIKSLTSVPNVNVQIAVDDGAALQALSSVHRVDLGRRARLVTGPIAGIAKHSVYSRKGEEGGEKEMI